MAAGVLFAMPAVLAFFSGGYGVKAQLLGCAVSLTVAGVLAVTAPWPLVRAPGALVACGALAGLALWSGISIEWARIRDLAANETAQLVLYASVFAAAAVVMRDRRVRALLVPVLLAGVLVVTLYSLAGRLLPDLVPTALSMRAGSRIQQPLTYWNALGLLMALGVLLGVALAAERRHQAALRAAACAATVPCSVVLYLTFSRGSLVALGTGFVVLVLARPVWATLAAGGVALVAAVVLGLIIQLFPALVELTEPASRQTGQGALFLAVLVVVTAAVAWAFARITGRPGLAAPLPVGRGALRGVAVVTAVAVIGMGWLIATGSEKTDPLPSSKSRLTKISTNRGEYWRVAIDSFGAHPLGGVGAGSFGVEWRRERSSDDFAQDAHSLYLETLAELGLVGGLLLAAFLIAVLRGLARTARDHADPAGAAAAACVAAFLVHVGIDWTWELPAVTLVALLMAAAGVQAGDPAAGAQPPAVATGSVDDLEPAYDLA